MRKFEYKHSDIIAGMRYADTIRFSTTPTNVEQALLQLTKPGHAGVYLLSKLKDKRYVVLVMECFTENSPSFEYGVIQSLAGKFGNQNVPPIFIEDNATSSTFHVLT
jgi:hypothetical protein